MAPIPIWEDEPVQAQVSVAAAGKPWGDGGNRE